MGPCVSETKIEETELLDADRPKFTDGEPLQRWHRHHRLPHNIAHLLSYLVGPIARANDDGGVNDGTTARIDGETLTLVIIARSWARPRFY